MLLSRNPMASADDFRRIALSFPGAEEGSHMAHPDFRVGGKIFATLGSPNADFGMVQLMPEQQEDFMKLAPEAFSPASGAWGRGGSTRGGRAAGPGGRRGAARAAAGRGRAPAGL